MIGRIASAPGTPQPPVVGWGHAHELFQVCHSQVYVMPLEPVQCVLPQQSLSLPAQLFTSKPRRSIASVGLFFTKAYNSMSSLPSDAFASFSISIKNPLSE